ncbi:hypothetical protein D7Y13_12660 [Corallococcus praedator]|uniref:Nucleotidyl transferase AbiEii/AbiGii toxin family protein n=1 Tax=Corallococcus praedator TaxID=2316724 RepID=A0ABX9QK03_9BACT|nr:MULTISPECIES: hypothetical protein [Corallococcus]RKH32550.1 hypothetical protein D7X75_15350 [Corallococcus sp. CA031C]RKI10485.1 hypothetical protein D7Y13_12660 [Corallococcus praedator]
MTEKERFDEILGELGELTLHLERYGFQVLLIGGQVLAMESIQRGGTGVIAIETDTGTVVERGFSFESDLLIDINGNGGMDNELPTILAQRGYAKRNRTFRWSKDLPGGPMDFDLFAPIEDVEPLTLPTTMTLLPDARLALRRKRRLELTIEGKSVGIHLPDATGFLAMKERAKRQHRPDATKDSFDMFAYVKLVGSETVRASLRQAGEEGRALRNRLLTLFWNASAPGPQDVINFATSLELDEKELLAQAAVDLFAEL